MGNRLSIYVSSPDSYADVFSIFYKAYRRFWSDCPYEFILATNTLDYEGINCICNNKSSDTWVERTIAALPQIKSKYILLMCDDLIITDKIDNAKIESILDYMDSHDIKYCRIKPLESGKRIIEQPNLNLVHSQTPYAINLQAGIFRIDMLVELLGNGTLSAWGIENLLNKQAAEAKDKLFSDVIAVNEPLLPFIHGVYKGKWMRDAVKYINKKYPCCQFERPVLPITTDVKIKLIDIIERMVSPITRRILKRILHQIGISFATKN